MKKIIMLFAFIGMCNVAMQAQAACCSKSGSKSCSKGSSAAVNQAPASDEAIAKAVSMDNSVEKRSNADGSAYYVRKEVCAKSGKVSYNTVEYCSKEGKFVNLSPAEMKACSKKGSDCCKKGGSAEAMSAPVRKVSNGTN